MEITQLYSETVPETSKIHLTESMALVDISQTVLGFKLLEGIGLLACSVQLCFYAGAMLAISIA